MTRGPSALSTHPFRIAQSVPTEFRAQVPGRVPPVPRRGGLGCRLARSQSRRAAGALRRQIPLGTRHRLQRRFCAGASKVNALRVLQGRPLPFGGSQGRCGEREWHNVCRINIDVATVE